MLCRVGGDVVFLDCSMGSVGNMCVIASNVGFFLLIPWLGVGCLACCVLCFGVAKCFGACGCYACHLRMVGSYAWYLRVVDRICS